MIRSLCLAVLFVIATAVPGCTSSKTMLSSAVQDGQLSLGSYDYVVILDAESASMIELELEQLFEAAGLKVAGAKEAPGLVSADSSVLVTRYTERMTPGGWWELTVLLEDFSTDRTLATIASRSGTTRGSAWKAVRSELREALAK